MLRRSLLGYSLIALLAWSGSLHAKESVVGFQVPEDSPSSVGKLHVPKADARRAEKDSVQGTSTLPSTSKSGSKKAMGKVVETAPAPEVKAEAPPPPPPPPEPPKTTGYNKGFYIQTADGRYRLQINGYAQFLTEYDRIGGKNTFGFSPKNVRITFSGNIFTKKLTYKLQLDFAQFKDNLLLDTWFNYHINDNVEFRVGQQDVPWIRQLIISSSNLELVDRSIAAVEFANTIPQDTNNDGKPDKLTKNGRDIGVVVQGTPLHKKLEYNVGFFNGSGTNATNFNNQLLYTGRAVYNITGDFGYEEGDYAFTEHPASFFGASGNYSERDITNDKVSQFGAETGVKYKGMALQGEFFYRHLKPGDTTLTTANDYGYYAQAGYFILPKRFEVDARASQIFLQGVRNDKAEFMLGLNGFLVGQHLKVQTDYSVLPSNTKNGVETAQRWRLKFQTKF